METTTTATLVAHSPNFKSQMVTREELAKYQAPVGTSTWRPVPHVELVGTILDQVGRYDLKVKREQYAVGKEGLALFGALDLVNGHGNESRGMALGFRHSNDKALAVQLVGGSRVFVCDNLSLSGEKIALHKHSRGLQLSALIRAGLEKFLEHWKRYDADVIDAEGTPLSDDDAKIRLFNLRYDGVLPVSIFDETATNYFRADALGYEDSKPRTVWGLHNAATRAVKALAPASQWRTLTDLGKAFGLGSDK